MLGQVLQPETCGQASVVTVTPNVVTTKERNRVVPRQEHLELYVSRPLKSLLCSAHLLLSSGKKFGFPLGECCGAVLECALLRGGRSGSITSPYALHGRDICHSSGSCRPEICSRAGQKDA